MRKGQPFVIGGKRPDLGTVINWCGSAGLYCEANATYVLHLCNYKQVYIGVLEEWKHGQRHHSITTSDANHARDCSNPIS